MEEKFGQVIKSKKDKLRVALIFPEFYETAMENNTLIKLYSKLNRINNIWCERVFMPREDFEKLLRLSNEKIYTLESKTPIDEMDILICVVDNKLWITNILNILNLGKIPILKDRRKDKFPVILFAGSDIKNIKPFKIFADILVTEYIEEKIEKICNGYMSFDLKNSKEQVINDLKEKINTIEQDIKENEYEKLFTCIIPSIKTDTNSNIIYVLKGDKEKKSEDILKEIKDRVDKTGENNITLITDCFAISSNIRDVIFEINSNNIFKDINIKIKDINLTRTNLWLLPYMIEEYVPTILVDNMLEESINTSKIRDMKKNYIYIAEQVFKKGFPKIKLKYTIGLQNETYEDLIEIIDLAQEIVNMYSLNYPNSSESTIVEVELLNYIGNQNTTPDKLELKARYIESENNNPRIKVIKHNAYITAIDKVLLKGDERIAPLVYDAWKNGARCYMTEDIFNIEAWKIAFQKNKISMREYLGEEKYEDSSNK